MRVCPLERFGEQVYIHRVPSWKLKLFHDGAMPDALFSPWWASTASSDRLCCSSWSCFRCAAALSACTLLTYPRLENHSFHRTRASVVDAAVPRLRPGFPILANRQSRRQIDRSRSKFADPRYRPRGRITKSVTVTTAYNRTILSGTAASAQ